VILTSTCLAHMLSWACSFFKKHYYGLVILAVRSIKSEIRDINKFMRKEEESVVE
jgi:hypothetical protein